MVRGCAGRLWDSAACVITLRTIHERNLLCRFPLEILFPPAKIQIYCPFAADSILNIPIHKEGKPVTKITFIGAGSLEFTSELVRDILTFPLLEDTTIALMDIHAGRLESSRQVVEKIIAAGKRPARVVATLNRAEALQGADVVLTTILAGSTQVWWLFSVIKNENCLA